MYRKTGARPETITRELARRFAEMPALPGERDLRIERIDELYGHLKDDNFRGTNWAEATDLTTGIKYRGNGNHSSNMLIGLSPAEFPEGLIATIDTYEFNDLAIDASRLFSIFDSQDSVRTNADRINNLTAQYNDKNDPSTRDSAHKMQIARSIGVRLTQQRRILSEEAKRLKKAAIQLAAKAADPDAPRNTAALAERRLLEAKKTQEAATAVGQSIVKYKNHGLYFTNGDASETYRKFAKWTWSVKTDAESRSPWILSIQGVVAEMLNNYIDCRDQAIIFWTLTFRDNHVDVNHPSRELARALTELRLSKIRRTQEEMMKIANKHWKKFLHYKDIPEKEISASQQAEFAGVLQ